MNFTYFKFLFINTIKRKPVWITWLLFVFTCICFIIILPLAAKLNTLQAWANTTITICQTFMGMTVALFTAVLAINIFKDSNEEGTELIVISKPITRMNIVIAKFLLFGLFCLAVNISAVLITMFTIFLPRTETRFYWGLVISMLIGNAVTFGVFGSIAILMSVNFAKVGIIVTNIVLSLVFLIYQALAAFVFPVPAKALSDAKVATPSYILQDRKSDGSYTESEIVKFTAANLDDLHEQKDIPVCKATDWKGMKEFWETQILGRNPTAAVNATDLAAQISLTYLSYGLDDYALRQAQRMFALSRYYNCELVSPASPEIVSGVENKKTLPWIYTGSTEWKIPIGEETTISVYVPSSFGFAGIKPITVTRLRGYTDKIPVGYTKSKELTSQRDVYFEKEDWDKYSSIFDEMYEKVFDYSRYSDLGTPEYLYGYDSFFAKNNTTVKRYYDIIWNTFMGKGKELSVFYNSDDDKYKYDSSTFNIVTADDLNERFIQFKYYCYLKALTEQQNLLTTAPTDIYKEAYDEAISEYSWLLYLGVEFNNWMIKASSGDCIIIEPNTQTVSYGLINTAWEKLLEKSPSIEVAKGSAKSIMNKTAAIFNTVCYPHEKYLFDSTTIASRNAKLTGEAHMVSDYWLPYLASWIVPLGQNLQYFYYDVHPVVEYWHYAVLWGCISFALFATGAIVYNKYDVK